MSPTLVIILIIVVWLIVLAPLLLRGQRPIHKSGEAFDETRVLYEGGSGTLGRRRQPRLRAEDVRSHGRDEEDDYELVEAEAAELVSDEDVLIDEPGHVVDGEVVADTTGSTAASAMLALGGSDADADADDEGLASVDDSVEAEEARGGTYDLDDTYTGPADLLHPSTRVADAADHSEVAELKGTEDSAPAEPEELSEEEVEFARRRSARGGWDPDLVAQRSHDLYARRRRTLVGLVAAVVVTLLVAVVVGGWMWVAPAVATGLTALYLSALRTQVRQESELRAVRVRHLRRARLGVRQSGVPAQLRHPAGNVLEFDDESPDFHDLAVTDRGAALRETHEDRAPRRSFRRVS
ncbi:divisome protein SepX/GlpR [Corynebacterium doosanense]|uniref:Uncharacterized protein n=1 Tax=Corynebacterium doosanense CAU 212 = DSM 45436 TaxID=558173 RepID=A0A097IEK0_9CORY|nr:gephyrin-like molybdotransferase receptor GlpR [Corynebacterium doosanense]AIT60567.1 hypothetical protein CDOO_04370 [Corynebacterium doosanense CAU 212 = DSM 45436]